MDGILFRSIKTTADAFPVEAPFASGGFELNWCEGAGGIVGSGNALRCWRALLRTGRKLALTEAVWLKPEAPEPVRRAFAEYPAMSDVDASRRPVRDCGYELLGDFVLPDAAWWDDYCGPMEKRLLELAPKYARDSVANAILEENRGELEPFRLHSACLGYVFLVTARS